MGSKEKRKMLDPDGEHAGDTPGTGLPLECLREPAYGWDTAATAAPMLEQRYDSLIEGTGAAGELHTGAESGMGAAAAALHTGAESGMAAAAAALHTESGMAAAAGAALHFDSGMAVASVPPASLSKLRACSGDIDRKGKRKRIDSDDDQADHTYRTGRRRGHPKELASGMTGASSRQEAAGQLEQRVHAVALTVSHEISISVVEILPDDVLLTILSKLTTFDMASLARTSKRFRRLVASPETRCFLKRSSSSRTILGAVVSRPISMYPVLLSGSLSMAHQRASGHFAAFWAAMARERVLTNVEPQDCKDGYILLREGHEQHKKYVLCNPLSRLNPTIILQSKEQPSGGKLTHIRSAFVPGDYNGYFHILVLEMIESDCPSIKSTKDLMIRCYASQENSWICKRVNSCGSLLTKSSSLQTSVVADGSVYYLEPCIHVISINLSDLTCGTIPLPIHLEFLRHNHVLVEMTTEYFALAVLCGQMIELHVYSRASQSWSLLMKLKGPGDPNTELVGSTKELLMISARDKLYALELQAGLYEEVTHRLSLVKNVLVYEIEFPPSTDLQ